MNQGTYIKDEKYEVTALVGDSELVARLQEMGFSQGAQVIFMGRMSFGGPLLFQIGPSFIALREEEAACMQIKNNRS